MRYKSSKKKKKNKQIKKKKVVIDESLLMGMITIFYLKIESICKKHEIIKENERYDSSMIVVCVIIARLLSINNVELLSQFLQKMHQLLNTLYLNLKSLQTTKITQVFKDTCNSDFWNDFMMEMNEQSMNNNDNKFPYNTLTFDSQFINAFISSSERKI